MNASQSASGFSIALLGGGTVGAAVARERAYETLRLIELRMGEEIASKFGEQLSGVDEAGADLAEFVEGEGALAQEHGRLAGEVDDAAGRLRDRLAPIKVERNAVANYD